MRYQIQVDNNGDKHFLSTYKDESFTISYSVADIRDISSRNTTFSKSIRVPADDNNRWIFDNIDNLASKQDRYNPNKRISAIIMIDGVTVMEGYLQFKAVDDVDGPSDYDCVIYSDQDDFFKNIEDKYIDELDWLDFDHVYNETNVVNSWTASNLGYFYGLIDRGNGWDYKNIAGGKVPGSSTPVLGNGISTSTASNVFVNTVDLIDMKPMTKVKSIWNKIMSNSGYSTDFQFENSDLWDNLLIDSNVDNIYGYTSSGSESAVGLSGSSIATNIYNTNSQLKFTQSSAPYYNNDIDMSTGEILKGSGDIQDIGASIYLRHHFNVSQGTTFTASNIALTNAIISFKFYRSRNPITGATDSNWANGLGYQIGNEFRIDGPVYEPNAGGYFTYNEDSNWTDGIMGKAVAGYTVSSTQIVYYNDYFLNLKLPTFDGSNFSRTPLYDGERVRLVYIFSNIPGQTPGIGSLPVNIATIHIFKTGNAIMSEDTFLYVTKSSSPPIAIGRTMDYSSAIPKKIKQKDFILSVQQMFNLYFIQNGKKQLLVQPRDEYYESGEIKDWTDRIDFSQPIKSIPLGDLQNKQILFSYKSDKDFLNTDYTGKTGDIYGQQLINIDNDFIKGVKKIEPIFSPTPLTKLNNSLAPWSNGGLVIPRITKDYVGYNYLAGGRIDHNVRVLLKNNIGLIPMGVTGVGGYRNGSNDQWAFNGREYYTYPYVGHFDNPYQPSYSIMFGTPNGLYYEPASLTNRTLYNDYYKQMVEEISDTSSKLITVEMFLSPNDINKFKFNDNIYLFIGGNGQYYRVNKIEYIVGVDTATVELIKTKKVVVNKTHIAASFSSSGISKYTDSYYSSLVTKPYNNVTSGDALVMGKGNNVNSPGIVAGDFNNVDGSNLVFGSYNSISGENSMSMGNNNIVTGDNTLVFGNGSTASGNNVMVFGNNITATQSNTTYFNNIVVTGNVSGGGISELFERGTGFLSIQARTRASLATGDFSYAEGWITEANGDLSHAEGTLTYANGVASHAEGNGTTASGHYSHAEGDITIARGESSHAEGTLTYANGVASHAEGYGTTASSDYSHAEGYNSIASGTYSHAEGYYTNASNFHTHAEGNGSFATGLISHAEGFTTLSSGTNSHSEGNQTIARGDSSHAEGYITKSYGDYSHAEGVGTEARGESSHAEGGTTLAVGQYSHVEGSNSQVSGNAGHAEGEGTSSTGQAAHSEGFETHSDGLGSHSEGYQTFATGDYSHAEGAITVASAQSSYSGGLYSTSSHYSEWSRSSDQIGQYGVVSYVGTTTNNTPTELFLDGSSERFTLIPNSIYTVKIQAVATIPATGNSKEWHGEGFLFKNLAGVTTAVGATTLISTNTDAVITAAILLMTANNANDSIKLEATGLLVTTINWFVKLEYTMIGNR
jgi:hypothetical protein